MVGRAPASAAELHATLAGFAETRISRVLYFGLHYEPRESVEWDFGEWHWPEHGVELTMEDGRTYSALWGDAFGRFDLEFLPGPMSTRLRAVGDPDGPHW